MATALPTQGEVHSGTVPGAGDSIIALLNRRLSDAIDLESRCREAAWNLPHVTGTALQELCSDLRAEAVVYVDALAVRIVELGGAAEASPQIVARRSGLLEVAEYVDGVDPRIASLNGAMTAFASRIRTAVYESTRHADLETAALCARISRSVEAALRQLKIHRQGST